ncbi:MAG: hypothetical protein AB7O44_26805 [Hyphomicrobiaceae bacterium]
MSMKAFRRLALFLGCLAVISAILPVTAFGSSKAADAAQRTSISDFCPNCHDCDPCQAANTGCSQVCVSPLPTLVGHGPALAAIERGDAGVPSRPAALNGLSRLPDPFPPRS